MRRRPVSSSKYFAYFIKGTEPEQVCYGKEIYKEQNAGHEKPAAPPISGKSGGKNGLKKENKLFRGIDEPPGLHGSPGVFPIAGAVPFSARLMNGPKALDHGFSENRQERA